MTKEALTLALEFIESVHKGEWSGSVSRHQAVEAIKEALAQPEQEPVACIEDGDLYFANEIDWQTLQQQGIAVQLLYTTPPQRTWVGLTDEELKQVRMSIETTPHTEVQDYVISVQKATQAKLKEKNTLLALPVVTLPLEIK